MAAAEVPLFDVAAAWREFALVLNGRRVDAATRAGMRETLA
jgi:hypothetical protein